MDLCLCSTFQTKLIPSDGCWKKWLKLIADHHCRYFSLTQSRGTYGKNYVVMVRKRLRSTLCYANNIMLLPPLCLRNNCKATNEPCQVSVSHFRLLNKNQGCHFPGDHSLEQPADKPRDQSTSQTDRWTSSSILVWWRVIAQCCMSCNCINDSSDYCSMDDFNIQKGLGPKTQTSLTILWSSEMSRSGEISEGELKWSSVKWSEKGLTICQQAQKRSPNLFH